MEEEKEGRGERRKELGGWWGRRMGGRKGHEKCRVVEIVGTDGEESGGEWRKVEGGRRVVE